MKFATVKAFAAKASIATFAAAALFFAGAAPAHAQNWGVAVQYGTPVYTAPAYVADPDDYYRARHEYWERERARREWLEHERREEFMRRQAWIRHERWEHERRYFHHDRDDDFDGYR
jgi:hypothetical protein